MNILLSSIEIFRYLHTMESVIIVDSSTLNHVRVITWKLLHLGSSLVNLRISADYLGVINLYVTPKYMDIPYTYDIVADYQLDDVHRTGAFILHNSELYTKGEHYQMLESITNPYEDCILGSLYDKTVELLINTVDLSCTVCTLLNNTKIFTLLSHSNDMTTSDAINKVKLCNLYAVGDVVESVSKLEIF